MKRADLAHEVEQRLVRLPKPKDNHYGVHPAAPPEGHVDLGEAGGRVEGAVAAMAQVGAIARELKDPYILSRILPRREAVSSSAIEGTNSTLDELLAVEEDDGRGSEAASQVRSYALALDKYIPKARTAGPSIFTLDLVKDVHREVMRDDRKYKDVPGELRTIVNWIGSNEIAHSTWNPPLPALIRECLAETVDYMRNEGMQQMGQNLIVRVAVAHAHFEAVHPFRDGNGRVGRLLLPLMMAADGQIPLYLSPYIEANKDAYYAALKDAQQRLRWDSFIGFVADAVVGTKDELLTTRTALAALAKTWRERRKFRQNSAAERAIELLPHYPVITAGRLGKLLDVNFRPANEAIAQLEECGILKETTGYSRNRVFKAPEALSIINRAFGEPPDPRPDAPPEPSGFGR